MACEIIDEFHSAVFFFLTVKKKKHAIGTQ